MLTPGSARHHDPTPSDYVRLEAQIASASADPSAVPRDASAPPGLLVLVAAADPDVRGRAASEFAGLGTGDPPTFRLESVATVEALVEALEREGVAVVVSGRLASQPTDPSPLDGLRVGHGGGTVVVRPTDGDPLHTLRLAEALSRLLHRGPE